MKMLKRALSYFTVFTLVISPMQVTNVFAAPIENSATPTITTIEQQGTSNVYLNWSVPIAEDEYFCTETFDGKAFDYSQVPEVVQNTGCNGGGWYYANEKIKHEWTDEERVTRPELKTLRVGDSYGRDNGYGLRAENTMGNGNQFYWYASENWTPTVCNESSIVMSSISKQNHAINYSDLYLLKKGRRVIIQADAKGEGKLSAHMHCGLTGRIIDTDRTQGMTWAENLTYDEWCSRVRTKTPILINNPSNENVLDIQIAMADHAESEARFGARVIQGEIKKNSSGQWCLFPEPTSAWDGSDLDGISHQIERPDLTYATGDTIQKPDMVYGAQIYEFEWGTDSRVSVPINSEDWVNYQQNFDIPQTNPSDYYGLRVYVETPTAFNVDKLRFAYAPKSRIYRNGTLISEDYTVEFTDSSSTNGGKELDSANPNPVPEVRATLNSANGTVDLEWDDATDNGTTYTYEISSVDSGGVESAKVSKDVTVTSGINFYRVGYNSKTSDIKDGSNKISIPLEDYKGYITVSSVDKTWRMSTPVEAPSLSLISVEGLSEVTVPRFTNFDAITFPTKTTMHTSLGDVEVGVDFSEASSSYNSSLGTQTLTGKYVTNNTRITELLGTRKPVITITTNKATITDLADIKDFPAEPSQRKIDTLYKKAPDLSAFGTTMVKVHPNGTEKETSISWDLSTLDLEDISLVPQRIYGTVASTSDFTVDSSVKPYIDVTVKKANLVSVTALPSIETELYSDFSSLSLPTTVQVVGNNGLTETCDVTWKESDYVYDNTTSNVVITGDISLPTGYVNTNNLKASINVEIKPFSVSTIAQPSASDTTNKLYVTSLYEKAFPASEVASLIEVTALNGHKENLQVEFNSNEFNPTQLGEQEITGTFKDVPSYINSSSLPTPKMIVNVVKSEATSVATISNKEIEVFDTFDSLNLPSTIDVTYNNGLTKSSAITWDESEFNSSSPTNYMLITGTLSVPTGYIIPSEMKASVVVKVKPANSCQIDTPDASNISNGLYQSVMFKTPISDITLPPTVRVYLDASHTEDVDVDFDTSTYNPNQLGEQHISGVFKNIPASIDSSTLPIPEAIINVTEVDVTSVKVLPQIEVKAYDSYDSLGLPSEIEVTFANGEKFDCLVSWDSSAYNNTAVGIVQTLTGDITIPYGYTNSTSIKATIAIKVGKVEVQPIETSALSTQVEFGTTLDNISLPTQIRVKSSNNVEENVPITIDTSSYKSQQLGTYNCPISYNSSNDCIDITSLPALTYNIEVVSANITEIKTANTEITKSYGTMATELTLPTEITARLSSGIDFKIPVSWDTSTFANNVKHQEFTATMSLPTGITNSNDLEYKAIITLNKVTDGRDIINIKQLAPIVVNQYGDVGCLPLVYEVQAELNSGETITIPVATWDLTNLDMSVTGTYEVTGITLPTDDYTNTHNIPIKQSITVQTITDSTIVQVLPLDPIEILPNESYTLPTKAVALLGDGTCTEVDIAFTSPIEVHSDYGVYYETATIVSGSNPLNLKPVQEIDIVDIFANDPVIVEVKPPTTVEAYIGQPYHELKFHKVPVRLSNNRWHYASASLSQSDYNNSYANFVIKPADIICATNYRNTNNLKAMVSVNVSANNIPDPSVSILGLAKKNYVTVDYGTPYTQIGVPDAKVILSNNRLVTLPAYWDFSPYSTSSIGKVDISGNLETTIDNPSSVRGQTELRVLTDNRDPDGSKTIVGLSTLKDITVNKGNLLALSELPTTVGCTLRNGSTSQVPIIWDYTSQVISRDMVINGTAVTPTSMYMLCSNAVTIKVNCNKSNSGSSGSGGASSPTVPVAPIAKNESEPEESKKEEKEETPKIPEEEPRPIIMETPFGTDLSWVPYTIPNFVKLKSKYTTPKDTLEFKRKNDSLIVTYTNIETKKREIMNCKILDTSPSSQTYIDVPSTHWAYKYILDITRRGYAKGKSSEEFRPSDKVAVGDICAFIDRVLVNNNHYEILVDRKYVDSHVLEHNHWAYYNVASIASKSSNSTIDNILAITSTASYDKVLTREEVAIIFYDVLTNCQINLPTLSVRLPEYNDASKIKNKQAVDFCTQVGLFKGDNLQNFNPDSSITRAELTTTLIRLDDLLHQ